MYHFFYNLANQKMMTNPERGYRTTNILIFKTFCLPNMHILRVTK